MLYKEKPHCLLLRYINIICAECRIFSTLKLVVGSSWNMMAHGNAREGKWRGNWRMQWVASTLHTTSEHGVSSITTADAHTSAASGRLNWRHTGRFKWTRSVSRERRNLVSACVPSHFKGSLHTLAGRLYKCNRYPVYCIWNGNCVLEYYVDVSWVSTFCIWV